MPPKDLAYKHGAWRLNDVENISLNKDKLLMSLIEKLKYDIENNDPSDKKSQSLINELLYHYCWKVLKYEKTEA